MKASPLPSLDLLFDRFYVDSTSPTGLRYAADVGHQAKARQGMVAGTPSSSGYCSVRIGGKRYLTHRIVHTLRTGVDNPELSVDHIDRNHLNNHPLNLRWADQPLQERNKPNRGKCLRGVTFAQGKPKPYQAQITVNNAKIYLGCYATEQEAHEAYLKRYSQEHFQ